MNNADYPIQPSSFAYFLLRNYFAHAYPLSKNSGLLFIADPNLTGPASPCDCQFKDTVEHECWMKQLGAGYKGEMFTPGVASPRSWLTCACCMERKMQKRPGE